MRPERAVILSLLAGYLLLPVKTSFDFSGVPALDKTSIANLATFVAATISTRGRAARMPREWWLNLLILVYLLSPIMTVYGNRDSLVFGKLFLPGLSPYDAFSAAAYKALDVIPLLLGYNLLRSAAARFELLRALLVAAIGYSLLMLIEIRLSPQLHAWIYGFFPHSFGQQMRDGGFRPVVFLGHGLVVAIFTAMAVTAATFLARARERVFGVSVWFWFAYLLAVMVFCRSLGALILALLAISIIMSLRKARALQIACATAAAFVLIYPALRGADLVPVQAIADQVAAFSDERAASFQTRIDNENLLLARANQRPYFGWGGYGRNRIYDEYSGKDLSITDGAWIIVVGNGGWIGYLATFGLLCLPIIASVGRGRQSSTTGAAISVVLIVNLLDCIPNASLGPITWLMAGTALIRYGGSARSRADSQGLTIEPRSDMPRVPVGLISGGPL